VHCSNQSNNTLIQYSGLKLKRENKIFKKTCRTNLDDVFGKEVPDEVHEGVCGRDVAFFDRQIVRRFDRTNSGLNAKNVFFFEMR
jgi:hypothetical protein